jgi:plastocyanin
VVVAVAALGFLAVGCGDEAERPEPPQRPGTVVLGGEEATDRGTAVVEEGADVALAAGDYYFEPTVLTGPPGADIDLVIRSAGRVTHNISLPEQQVDEDIAPGGSTEIRMTVPRTGSAVFFCSYHRGRGMLGALVAA